MHSTMVFATLTLPTSLTYEVGLILTTESVATSCASLSRQFGHMDGLDRVSIGRFATRTLTLLGIIMRPERRGLPFVAPPADYGGNCTLGLKYMAQVHKSTSVAP
jgi:hypothetical protein